MTIRWTPRAQRKISDNGVSRDEAEDALENANRYEISRSSGRPIACRWQGDRWLYVVFEDEEADVVRPVTAFYPEKDQ